MNKKIISTIMALTLGASSITGALAAETNEQNPNTDVKVEMLEDNSVNVTVGDDLLVENVDYTLTYENNINVGTGTVIITFKGNYSGTLEKDFTIKKNNSSSGNTGSSGKPIASTQTPAPEVSEKPVVVDNNNTPLTDSTVMEDNTITITVPSDIEPPVRVFLPNDKTLTDGNSYTIKVVNDNKEPVTDIAVVVSDKNGKREDGVTNGEGVVIVPNSEPTESPEGTVHSSYINGYQDGTFRPDDAITRAETAVMLLRLSNSSEATELDNTFSDVANDAWYKDAINKTASLGYINGYEDGTFRPENKITRAEFAAILTRIKGVDSTGELPFDDVNTSHWGYNSIYSAYSAGYIAGYDDNTFRPDMPITRAEAVKMINMAFDRTDYSNTENPFVDVSPEHWAYQSILEAAVSHNV